MGPNATSLVRAALGATGIDVVGSCPAADYDAVAPRGYRSTDWMPGGARGLVVAGSAGPTLWRNFAAAARHDRRRWDSAHPYDTYVAELLSRADAVLSGAGVTSCRFEAAFAAPVRVDFIMLARLAGLGSPGPFRLLIHDEYGPWWALRGAWLVDADVDPPRAQSLPCKGCPAPCVGGWDHVGDMVRATPEVRGRCVVGQEHRYDDDQIAYHYDRDVTRARLATAPRDP